MKPDPMPQNMMSDQDPQSLSIIQLSLDSLTGSKVDLIKSLDKYSKELKCSGTVNVPKFCTPKFLTKWHMQTVPIQIRLQEQSDQGLHCLPFHLVF